LLLALDDVVVHADGDHGAWSRLKSEGGFRPVRSFLLAEANPRYQKVTRHVVGRIKKVRGSGRLLYSLIFS
jgi:hypothetical protein